MRALCQHRQSHAFFPVPVRRSGQARCRAAPVFSTVQFGDGCMDPTGKIELPSAFEDADVDHLVVLIADMLDRLIEHNDRIPLSP